MASVSNHHDKNANGLDSDMHKELRQSVMYELFLSIPLFAFVLVYYVQSFGYPKAAARLPRLVCIITFILFFVYFIQLWRWPEKYSEKVSENPNPKRLWGTLIASWCLPIIWALVDYRIAVLLVSEAMLLILGVKNKLLLIAVPVVLSLGMYFVFTKYLYIPL